ncbi:ABC transporter ATP-binding protein [Sporomusa termitida]|uniref:Bicarbonate transport ATP-binding protein CmpD n=1 Tax=Sporomusa termitida TaxID=2377 RepID=A0A517E1J4_9FIRM|nr:ABC transporter ATP-binding protein [Sporomusa termitida]QDR83386.1 Bicarbonate transport ATP-binding protein CmpD [Sporomusa termitida]
MAFVKLNSVTKFFSVSTNNGEAEGMTAILDISLSIRRGEFISIVGPSGCGKSTILNMIAGLQLPTEGTVTIDGKVVLEPPPVNKDELRDYEKKYRFLSPVYNSLFKNKHRFDISMVFQDHSIYPWKTALNNITFALRLRGIAKEECIVTAKNALAAVGLAGFENNYPYQLSGGMRQRVALARALAVKSKILLMDEPFGLLDGFNRERLQEDLSAVWSKTSLTVVYITHDIEEAVYLSDRVVLMAPSPGVIRNIIPVELPRPRRRTNPEFKEICTNIQKIFHSELTGEYEYGVI